MFFEDLKNQIISLDIETSGLSPENDWIWSIGTSSQKGAVESFVRPRSRSKIQELFDPKNQIFDEPGYHDAYKSSLSKGGGATSKTKALNSLFKQMDKDSIVLVQNLNFENKHIAAALTDKQAVEFADKFAFVLKDNDGRLLYRPPEVTKAMHEAARATNQMFSARTGAEADHAIKNVNQIYKTMLGEYEKAISAKKGIAAVDLMDITKATYAMAADKGLIKNTGITSGLTVDFLSKIIYSKAEEHGALADAEDQEKIFYSLMNMYDEMDSGNISQDTHRTFKSIKSAQSLESSRLFISGLKSTLEEIQREGSTQLLGTGIPDTYVQTFSGVDYTMRGESSKVRTRSSMDAMSHVVERYSKHKTAGIDLEQTVESLRGMDLADQISKLKDMESEFKAKVTRRIAGTQSVGERISDRYKGIKDKKAKAGIAALGLGIAAYGMSGSEGSEKKDYKRAEEVMKHERSNEKTFAMFSRPEVYHGTGVYLWDNITNHHVY